MGKLSPPALIIIGALLFISWIFLFLVYLENSSQDPEAESTTAFDEGQGRRNKKEMWYEIHMDNRKIGYRCEEVWDLDKGILIKERTLLLLSFMGVQQPVVILGRYILEESFVPKDLYFRFQSGVYAFVVRGKAVGKELVVQAGIPGSLKEYRFPFDSPILISGGLRSYLKNLPITPNEAHHLILLDPITLKPLPMSLKVLGKETLEIMDRQLEVTLVEAEIMGAKVLMYLDAQKEVVKEKGLMGLTITRSSKALASTGLVSSKDLVFQNAIRPKGKKIVAQERLSRLELRIKGGDLIPEDHRQRRKGDVWVITRERVPSSPEGLSQAEVDTAGFLRPGPGIESDSKKIKDLAESLSGNEKDPIKVAKRFLAWVYARVEKRPTVSIPSALTTLEQMAGDCNEHAALLTALLRASGIPARVVVGLCINKGEFFYHAWTEAFFGTWVSIDPSLNQMPCDVTHIRLFHLTDSLPGPEVSSLLVGMLGKVEIEVLGFEYD